MYGKSPNLFGRCLGGVKLCHTWAHPLLVTSLPTLDRGSTEYWAFNVRLSPHSNGPEECPRLDRNSYRGSAAPRTPVDRPSRIVCLFATSSVAPRNARGSPETRTEDRPHLARLSTELRALNRRILADPPGTEYSPRFAQSSYVIRSVSSHAPPLSVLQVHEHNVTAHPLPRPAWWVPIGWASTPQVEPLDLGVVGCRSFYQK